MQNREQREQILHQRRRPYSFPNSLCVAYLSNASYVVVEFGYAGIDKRINQQLEVFTTLDIPSK